MKALAPSGRFRTARNAAAAGTVAIAMVAAAALQAGSAQAQTSTTPVAAPSANAGSAPLGSTNYNRPAGAIYVSSSNGNDTTGTGTVTSPVQTVNKAMLIATNGSTIILRGGVYHESVNVNINRVVTIQNFPNETVWFDGSSQVDTWTSSGNGYVHDGWTAEFDSTAGYTAQIAGNTAANWNWVNAAHPMAAHPDQVWIDDVAQQQVGSAAELTPGTFYVDYTDNQLYLGSDPTGHTVRASDLAVAMVVVSANTVIRGIGFRRYATPLTAIGTVKLRGSGDVMQNVIVTDSASEGIYVAADHVTLDHVTSQLNGSLGIHANYADGLMITGSVVRDNNTQQFNYAPASGGIKISRTRTVTVRFSVVNSNAGTGIWFDESTYNFAAYGNIVRDNRARGITAEISSTGTIANNAIQDNSDLGLFIEDTDRVNVWNNTFANNAGAMQVYQDKRTTAPSTPGHDPRQVSPDPTMPWQSRNITIANNIVSAGGTYLLTVSDGSGVTNASGMNVTLDGNLFAVPTIKGNWAIAWGVSTSTLKGYNAASFAVATTTGLNNRDAVPTSSGYFADDTVALTVRPVGLDAGVASIIGKTSGTKYVGAFWTVAS